MAPRVRWVHCRSAGLDTMLFPELVESPVTLTNGRGVFSRPLGEFAIGAVLFFAKDFRRMVRSQEAGAWDPFDVEEIAGKTIGIVGYGDIGRAVAGAPRPWGWGCCRLRRRPGGISAEGLMDLLARSDYVVVAAAAHAGNPRADRRSGTRRHEAHRRADQRGARAGGGGGGAARGLAREAHPRRGARCVRRRAAARGASVYSLDNVLLSPHCADHTPDWLERAMRSFLENYARYRRGEPLRNVVDKRRGY